jgi:hypothetical protein
MRFDGEEVESVFSFGEFFGTYEIAATFATGQVVTVEVYPRPGDDNSSQIRITPQGVVPYGDLRYKVISITKAKK